VTLFELQAWLGHKDPATTQNYAKITPNTLTRAYTQAGYFARNVRTIEVLLDRDAVASGAAGGQSWQHYDLGHGYCSYTFFEQCPHRMACARCDFYIPKKSGKAQLLEAKDNLQRMLASIPLTDDERAAVDDEQAALDSLLGKLANVPTPAGATPRQMAYYRQPRPCCQSSTSGPKADNRDKPDSTEAAWSWTPGPGGSSAGPSTQLSAPTWLRARWAWPSTRGLRRAAASCTGITGPPGGRPGRHRRGRHRLPAAGRCKAKGLLRRSGHPATRTGESPGRPRPEY
jgi:hypothetical protein